MVRSPSGWLSVSGSLVRIEHERSQFDALSWWSIFWSGWILERCVRRESGATVFGRVVALQQQCFVALQSGYVVPAMSGVVFHLVDLTGPVPIDEIARQQITSDDAAGIADSERR